MTQASARPSRTMRVLKSAAWIVASLLACVGAMVVVLRLYPHPILMLFDGTPPPIRASAPVNGGRVLRDVVKRYPAVATQKGLIAELAREGFSFEQPYLPERIADMKRRGENTVTAHYAWDVDPCTDILYVSWQADRAGRMQSLFFDEEVSCRSPGWLEGPP